MQRLRVRSAIGILVACLLLAAACGSSDDDASGEGTGGGRFAGVTIDDDGVLSEEVTVRVGVSAPVPALLAAVGPGIWDDFEKRNIHVDTQFVATADSTGLLSTGRLDARLAGMSAGSLNAIADGVDIRVVAPGQFISADDPSGIYVSTAALDGREFEPAMLRGERIASSQGSAGSSAWGISELLDEGGLEPDDVEVVTISIPDSVAALENGSVMAAVILAPLHQDLVDSGAAVRVADFYPTGWPGPVWEYGPSLFVDNPDVGRAFAAALLDMYMNHLQGDYLHDERVELISEALDTPVDVLSPLLSDEYPTVLEFPSDFYETMDTVWRRWDNLTGDTPMTNADVIDTRFLEYANSLQG